MKTRVCYFDSLENFLIHLSPLQHLRILLNTTFYGGVIYSGAKGLETISKVHGPNLRSLIWDEKAFGLHSWYGDSSIGYLGEISRYCPKLEALGWAWDWSSWRPRVEFQNVRVVAVSLYDYFPVRWLFTAVICGELTRMPDHGTQYTISRPAHE